MPQAMPSANPQSSDPNGPNYVKPDPNQLPPDPAAQDAASQAQQQQQQQAAAAAAAKQAYENHFNYGGVAGGANAAQGYFNGLATNAENRSGVTIANGAAQAAYQQGQQANGYQNQLAQMMLARANGSMPSVAQMQADRQMGQATAAQNSMAASARGPAGLALAQQQAAGNIAGMQSNISGQAQINGAQEQIQNQNAAFGAFSGMRGQDLQGMQQQAQMAQAQAALTAQQRAQNDQFATNMYGLGNQIQTAQLGAQGNEIGIQSGAQTAANNLALQSKENDQNQVSKYVGYGLGAAGTAAGVLGMLGVFGGPAAGSVAPSVSSNTMNGNNDFNNSGSSAYTDSGGNSIGSSDPNDPSIPPTSDVTAKKNISPLSYGLGVPMAAVMGDPSSERVKAREFDRMKAAMEAQRYGLLSQGPAVRGDTDAAKLQAMAAMDRNPTTMQFATGLAPSTYEYRDPNLPGRTPGMKMGPMAQNMAANPLTATAVRQGPNGLLGIDNADGLKVALGGVGHLAQRQQATDAEVARLRAEADMMKQQKAAQYQGLLQNGPSVGAYQPPTPVPGADPRMVEADRMLNDVNAQGQGLLSQGPSVGQQYLDYTRGN